MDENKEFMIPAGDSVVTEPNTDTINTENDLPDAPSAKKRTLNRTIIISAVIVGVVLVAAIVCRLFFSGGLLSADLLGNKTATTWHYAMDASTGGKATSDEAPVVHYYFEFSPDNKLLIHVGSYEYNGTYNLQHLSSQNIEEYGIGEEFIGKSVLNIENTGGMIDGKFLTENAGNLFSGETLTITNIYNEEVKLTFDKAAYTPVKVEREGEFTKDDKVVGNWTYRNELAYQTLSFNGDGTFKIKSVESSGAVSSYSGIYNCKDGKITLTYIDADKVSVDFKYTVEGDKFNLYRQVQTLDSETGQIKLVEEPIEYTKDK